jgi:hypothetical protein
VADVVNCSNEPCSSDAECSSSSNYCPTVGDGETQICAYCTVGQNECDSGYACNK